MLIRPTTGADVDALPGIERRAGAIFRQWPGLEWIADDAVQSADAHRALIAHGVSLVAEAPGGGLAGFLAGEWAPDALHIREVSVDPAHHRQGVGASLIAAAREIAARKGVAAMTLTTFRAVPWNAPYYERLGFRVPPDVELTPWLRKVLEDEALAGLPADQRCAMRLGLL